MHVDVLFLKENSSSYPEILEQGLKFFNPQSRAVAKSN